MSGGPFKRTLILLRKGDRAANSSPKTGNRHFYKGNQSNKGGRLTSKGNFIKDPYKLKFLEVPDLTGFKLKPYVSHATPRVPEELRQAYKLELKASQKTEPMDRVTLLKKNKQYKAFLAEKYKPKIPIDEIDE